MIKQSTKLAKSEEALKAFNHVIEQNAADAETFNNKGNALYELQRHEEAIIAFDKAIELDRSYFRIRKRAGYYRIWGNMMKQLLCMIKLYHAQISIFLQRKQ